jgi:hypothetical protein
MDYIKKELPTNDDASEVREAAVTYAPWGRTAIEPWLVGNGMDGSEESRRKERLRLWERFCADGDETAKTCQIAGVTTEEEFMEIVNEEIHLYREEKKSRDKK